MPARLPQKASWQGHEGSLSIWREEGQISGQVEGLCDDGMPVMVHGNQASYLCGWPDQKLLRAILKQMMEQAGITCHDMPDYLRVRQRGTHLIFTHYGPETVIIPDSFEGKIILGQKEMCQADVTIMEMEA